MITPWNQAEPREEHFHLLTCSNLALIQDNETVIERTATHVSKWCYFNDLALEKLGDFIESKHFI